jgi:hypothetical protein
VFLGAFYFPVLLLLFGLTDFPLPVLHGRASLAVV